MSEQPDAEVRIGSATTSLVFENFAILASPYPTKTLKGNAGAKAQGGPPHYEAVCRAVRASLKSALHADCGHAEPTEDMDGIRVYFATRQLQLQALKLKTIEALGANMRLTAVDPHHLSATLSNKLIVYGLQTDVVEMYRGFLLRKFFKTASKHSVDVRDNDFTGITACVSFPPASLSEYQALQKELDGMTLFSSKISCFIVQPQTPPQSGVAPRKSTVQIECHKPCSRLDMEALFTTLAIEGYLDTRPADCNPRQSSRYHLASFATPLGALTCRGLLSGGRQGSLVASVSLQDMPEEPLGTPSSHSCHLFLSGFESSVEEIYAEALTSYFSMGGLRGVTISHISRLHGTAVIEFLRPLDSAVTHTWFRSDIFDRPIRYYPIPRELAEGMKGGPPALVMLRISCGTEVSVKAMDMYLRQHCKGEGFLGVQEGGSRQAEREFRALFVSKDSPGVAACLALPTKSVTIAGECCSLKVAGMNDKKPPAPRKRGTNEAEEVAPPPHSFLTGKKVMTVAAPSLTKPKKSPRSVQPSPAVLLQPKKKRIREE